MAKQFTRQTPDLEVGGSSLTGHVVSLDKDILLGGNPAMD